jgi:hypothetical protein
MSDQVSTVRQQQAPTIRIPKRLSLVQPLATRDNTLLKDARLANAYAEKQPDGSYEVRKRPCLPGQLFLGAAGQADGFFFGNGWIYAVILTGLEAATLFAINAATFQVYNLGAVNGTGLQYAFDNVSLGSTDDIVMMGNGVQAYSLSSLTSIPPTVTPVTDPNFPTSFCPGWATLDGTTYVMDTQARIFGSNVNDPLVWSALNFILANSDSDQPVGLAKHLTYVIAFKQWTTNVFYDAGNPPPGSPLSPVQGALIPYGCLAMSTVQEIDGQLFWLTTGQDVAPQVGNINQLSFSIVSTPQVDRVLQSGGAPNEFYSFTLKLAGHRFYGITNYIQNYTLVYDLDQQLWMPWYDYLGANSLPTVLMTSQTFSAYTTSVLGLGLSNGLMYSVQPDYWASVDAIEYAEGVFTNAAPIVDIYTPSFDADTRRRKHLNMMFFNGDKVGGSTLQVRHNDDDYGTNKWSNFRTVNLNAVTPMLVKEGTFRRRAYHFRHQAATPFRLSSVDLQLDLGTL